MPNCVGYVYYGNGQPNSSFVWALKNPFHIQREFCTLGEIKITLWWFTDTKNCREDFFVACNFLFWIECTGARSMTCYVFGVFLSYHGHQSYLTRKKKAVWVQCHLHNHFFFFRLNFPSISKWFFFEICCEMLNGTALSTAYAFIILLCRWLQFRGVKSVKTFTVCVVFRGPWDPVLFDSFPKPENFPS